MEGATRAQLDAAENKDFALGAGPKRPRDAATLILLERQPTGLPKVLMGRRHASHAFMPGKYVFPGGRTDPDDARIKVESDLLPSEQAKLLAKAGRTSLRRARAIALSAIRETYEEAGLLIGHKAGFSTASAGWSGFQENGVQPGLDLLRMVARAITPPGRVRRYDTRFFACWSTSVAVRLPNGGPTDELEAQVWLTLDEAMDADIPAITKTILNEMKGRLDSDPTLSPGGPVPFYRMLHNRFHRTVL